MDLVNDNYTSFLSLGQKLSGGEERIEQVRVNLLGFHRDVTGLRDLVNARSTEVRALLEQKATLRNELQLGRSLLEVDERLTDLEERMNLDSTNTHLAVLQSASGEEDDAEAVSGFKGWSEDWSHIDDPSFSDDDDGDDNDFTQHLPRGLRRNVNEFQIVQQMSRSCGYQHPFILAQADRMTVIGTTLRKGLDAAIRAQNDVKIKQKIIQMKTKIEDHD